jgi:hypothetical protein
VTCQILRGSKILRGNRSTFERITVHFLTPSVFPDPRPHRSTHPLISKDHRLILMYLSLKGLNTVEIHSDLVATFKGDVKSYSTVTYSLRRPSFSSPKSPHPSESPAPIFNESDEATLLALSQAPFASVPQLARRIDPHHSTIYDHPTHKLRFIVRYLRCVPHLLSEADKHTRAQLLFELFAMLQHQKDGARHDIVTL